MNRDFVEIIAAAPHERRDLFLGAAQRLGTTEQNIEKDFWACWTLDLLFNGLPAGAPALLLKGGTSLSKAFGLIERFSEDIDITVRRADLGQPAEVAELECLSRKQRDRRLDAIKCACHRYIHHTLLACVQAAIGETVSAAGIPETALRVAPDDDDPDGQSLLLLYPPVTKGDGYVRQAVKIEAGAKSAFEPIVQAIVRPYIAHEMERLNLDVPRIDAVSPARTFWDKVILVHGMRSWFEQRGSLPNLGQRVSRHYYDLYRLVGSETGSKALEDRSLAHDCVRHTRVFFGRPDLGLDYAIPGKFRLTPAPEMLPVLRRDFVRMSGMIMGPAPPFDAVVAKVTELERTLNL